MFLTSEEKKIDGLEKIKTSPNDWVHVLKSLKYRKNVGGRKKTVKLRQESREISEDVKKVILHESLCVCVSSKGEEAL